MLRRLSRQLNDERDRIKLERKTSKRERISQFFRRKSIKRSKPQQHDEAPTKTSADETLSLQPSRGPEQTNVTNTEPSESSSDVPKAIPLDEMKGIPNDETGPQEHQEKGNHTMELHRSKSPIIAPQPAVSEVQAEETPSNSRQIAGKDEDVDLLSVEDIRTLFSSAPEFSVKVVNGQPSPKVSYLRDGEVKHDNATDSIPLAQPSYTAATAGSQLTQGQSLSGDGQKYHVYQVEAMEIPSCLSAQGVEPGSIGFAHFVELPQADSLVTEPQYDEGTEEFVETARNKELLQTNPERIGIRAVDMNSVYDRLIQLQDLYEAFQQSPERITILNNQSPGDLYGHLFGTFLTPPGYAGANLDPTGLQVQVLALLRVLNLKGIWHDFSLVEWRIRLGQVLFSDPEPVSEQESRPLWMDRDILLLQISLSCELLLRLDAITATRAGEVDDQTQISAREIETFASLKTRKTEWDLLLARRFLENILVIKGDDTGALTPTPESRGLFSIFGGNTLKELPRSEVIFLPQHQTRQLSGLLHFAESIKWPTIDTIVKSLAKKLGVAEQETERTTQPSSPSAWSFNPTTPSVVSVYGTPLQTPRSTSHQLDDYFGRVQKPAVRRNDSRSLRVPLSTTLLSLEDSPKPAVVDIGGWLSRSFLTGLILPGEAISHFLISTLLENDQLAILALGDSADLYGGFVYHGKTWWSKASIVGRVLACTDGAQECMGWIYLDKLPEGTCDGWYSIRSELSPIKSRLAPEQDLVAADSSALPAGSKASVKSTDLIMPTDLEYTPKALIHFIQWDLTPLNIDLVDDDMETGYSTESDVHMPSLTFQIDGSLGDHVLTLTHDVQFVASWPCFTPASTSVASPRHVAKQPLTGTLSHTSSKRSVSTKLSRRNSHGFEPLLSHPPEAADIGPQRSYATESDSEQANPTMLAGPVVTHPIHASYLYKVVPVTEVLESNFILPFTVSANKLPTCSSSTLLRDGHEEGAGYDDHKTVLVLDARGTSDHELLARAWCAEKALHAIIGRVERTCLACCIREARGLGINIVIRV